MRQIQYSSGDLVADRRASYAAALAIDRAFAEAADLMGQALELVPDWVAGWNLLGSYREEAGDVAGAVAAWQQVLQRDVTELFGARLKLAAYGVGGELGPAQAYVEALFDDYAPRFEQSLVGQLGYRTPDRLAELIAVHGAMRGVARGRAIDLGCGTGLMGERLRPMVDRLEGVDLSAGMLARAEGKRIYDRLVRAELVEFLRGEAGGVQLIVAADVFNYVGALEPALSAAHAALGSGGLLAFSLETHSGGAAVQIGASMRFQHAAASALALCGTAGFRLVTVQPEAIRMDRGQPVPGLIVLAARD